MVMVISCSSNSLDCDSNKRFRRSTGREEVGRGSPDRSNCKTLSSGGARRKGRILKHTVWVPHCGRHNSMRTWIWVWMGSCPASAVPRAARPRINHSIRCLIALSILFVNSNPVRFSAFINLGTGANFLTSRFQTGPFLTSPWLWLMRHRGCDR